MTEIQEEALPPALAAKDLIAQAKTGSGKTAAFGIPLILKIDTNSRDPQALIITPTRELADQVTKELRRLARYKKNLKITTLCGGVPMRGQIASLAQGAHILVGTPGRLQDHLSRGTLPCFDIRTLVLDEADRMLDMGFMEAIDKIISNLPAHRQTLLFSATYPEKIRQLSSHILKNPEHIVVTQTHTPESIHQSAYTVEAERKIEATMTLLQSYQPETALIFCNTKVETDRVAEGLSAQGFEALSLHGDLEQRDRHETLLRFSNGSMPILVATDVASRGLDVEGIDIVLNYDLPRNPEVYLHRIGRTGRAGASGRAVSFCLPHERSKFYEIAPQCTLEKTSTLKATKGFRMPSLRVTLCIDGGKKSKLRAGDILGTLCQQVGIDASHIGNISLFERHTYVALDRSVAKRAYGGLKDSKIKKQKFRVWWL